MTKRLLYDVWRCHDALCPQREDCLRWLDRHTGTVHTASLSNEDGTCYAMLPTSPDPPHAA